MAVTDWSTDPNLNVMVNGIDISEGCPSANLNNGLREIMAAVRVMNNGLPNTSNFVANNGGVFQGTQPRYAGRGAYLHNNDPGATSGRVFRQSVGGTPPAGMVDGDILLEWE